MDKKSRNGVYVMIFIALMSVSLICVDQYFNVKREERFYQRTEEAHQRCLEDAKSENVDARWCDEIRRASTQTYSSAKRSNYNSFSMFILVFAGLLIGLVSLKSQLIELKDKLDV